MHLEQFPYDEDDSPARKRDLSKLIESDNVCEFLDDAELRIISDTVLRELEIDSNDASRTEKLRKWIDGMKLAKQIIDGKDYPWTQASNVKYPILTNAAIQFSARAYPAIVSPTGVVKKKVIGRAKKEINAGSAYGSEGNSLPTEAAQSGAQKLTMDAPALPQSQQGGDPNLPQQQQAQPSRSKDQIASDAVEFMNYQLTCEMPEWLPDTDRLLQQLSLYGCMYRKLWYSKIKGRMASKILTPLQFIIPANCSDLSETPRSSELFTLSPNQIESNIRSGIFRDIDSRHWGNLNDSEGPQELVEQQNLLDLDGDGYKEPYIITVHINSREVVRIKANFKEKDIYLEDKVVAYIKKCDYHIEYVFIPSLDGTSYCTGFFDLAYHINDVINSTMNQLLDAGSLANTGGGFVSNDIKMERGPLKFNIGEYKAVNARGDDIRKGLIPMQFPGANPTLFNLLEFLLNAAREITNVKDILLDSASSNTPATTTMALIEQGTKVYNGIFKRIHHSLSREFKILKRLNAEYLNPNVYINVIDANVSASDFADDSLDFEPVSDPEISSDMQRMAQAQFLQPFLVDPLLDPIQIRLRILRAAKIENPEELIKPPQQPQPPPEFQIEMQKLQLESQKQQQAIAEMSAKFALEDQKMQILKDESDAKIVKLRTASMLDLANAESKELGDQMAHYDQEVARMDEQMAQQHELRKQQLEQEHQLQQQQLEQDYGREQQREQISADQQGRTAELDAAKSNPSVSP